MIETEKYIRKPLYVDAVRVTNANFDEIAAWCQGEVQQDEGQTKKHIKVRVHNPKNPRQTKAFVGDWLLYTERGYKVYTNRAFHAAFDQVEGATPKVETETPTRLGNVSLTPEEKDQRAVRELDRPLSEEEEAAEGEAEAPVVSHEYEPVEETEALSPMAQAVETIEAEGGTVEPATPEGIADAVAQNEQARLAEGKRILSIEEQQQMDQDEIRELIQSGEAVLVQDLAA